MPAPECPTQPAITPPERITFQFLGRHALELFNLERGLGFTVWRWAIQPRRAAQQYLFEDRSRYVKPFTLLALTVSLIAYVSFQVMGLQSQISVDSPQLSQFPEHLRPALHLALNYVIQFFNLFLVVSLPFQAAVNRLLFAKSGFHYPEHLVVVVYLYSIQTLITLLTLPVILWQPDAFGIVSSLLPLVYLFWSMLKIFQTTWWRALLAFLVYLFLGSLIPGLAAGILFLIIMALGVPAGA